MDTKLTLDETVDTVQDLVDFTNSLPEGTTAIVAKTPEEVEQIENSLKFAFATGVVTCGLATVGLGAIGYLSYKGLKKVMRFLNPNVVHEREVERACKILNKQGFEVHLKEQEVDVSDEDVVENDDGNN